MKLRMTTSILAASLALGVPAMAQESTGTGTGTGTGAQTGDQTQTSSTMGTGGSTDCPISFDVSDDDGDGYIAKSEWDSWRDQNFSTLDANGDGEITRQEYRDCTISSAGMQRTGDGAADMAELDTDQDRSVSSDEYMQATQDAETEAQQGPEGVMVLRRVILLPTNMSDEEVGSMSKAETAGHSAQTFAALDSNQDGQLSEDEWNAADSDKFDMSDYADSSFDKLDADGSDSVSQSEYRDASDRRWQNAQSAQQAAGEGDSGAAGPSVYYLFFAPAGEEGGAQSDDG